MANQSTFDPSGSTADPNGLLTLADNQSGQGSEPTSAPIRSEAPKRDVEPSYQPRTPIDNRPPYDPAKAEDLPLPKPVPETEFDSSKLIDHFKEQHGILSALGGKPSDGPRPVGAPPMNDNGEEVGRTWGDWFAGLWDARNVGWQRSISGLLERQKNPDLTFSHDADMFYKIVGGAYTMAGDLPAMLAAGIAGSPAGPVVSAASTFAAPAAMRRFLMESYARGDSSVFNDFWAKTCSSMIDGVQAGSIGALTAATGGLVNSATAPLVGPLIGKTAQLASEVGMMTTLGAAINHQMPTKSEFLENAILIAGVHGVTDVAPKLMTLFAERGIPPSAVSAQAEQDQTLKENLVSTAKTVQWEGQEIPVMGEANATGSPEPGSLVSKLSEERGSVSGKPSTEEPPQPPRSEAVQKVMDLIGDKTKPEKEGKSASDIFNQLYTDHVDELHPIKVAEKKAAIIDSPKPMTERGYENARMANDAPAKILAAIKYGTIDFNTHEQNGESFENIYEPFKNDKERLDAYLAARQAKENIQKGLKSPIDLETAEAVLKEGKDKYEDAAKRFTEFDNRNLDYFAASGRISQATKEQWIKKWPNYGSLKYLLDPEGEIQTEGGTGNDTGFTKNRKGFDAKTGTKEGEPSREGPIIQSPLRAMLENTQTKIKLAEINKAKAAFIKAIEANPDQSVFTDADPKTVGVSVSKAEMQKRFDKAGIPATAEAMEFFKKMAQPVLKENQFDAYIDGQRVVKECSDLSLAKAIKAIDGNPIQTSLLLKMAKGLTSVSKIGAVTTPEFPFKHLFRTYLQGATFTKQTLTPMDVARAMGDLWNKNDTYQKFLVDGGAQGVFVDIQKVIDQNLGKLQEETNLFGRIRNRAESASDKIHAMAMFFDQSVKLAKYKTDLGDATDPESRAEAGWAARDATVDYSRIGAREHTLNAITEFKNLGIQATDKFIRYGLENPKDLIYKGFATITAPTIAFALYNRNNEKVKNVAEYQRHLSWLLPLTWWSDAKDPREAQGLPPYLVRRGDNGQLQIDKGPVLRFMLPPQLALPFKVLPEMLLNKYFEHDPDAFHGLGGALLESTMPSLIPDVAKKPFEQATNWNSFMGTPLVPFSQERKLPQDQYSPGTSETAKTIGKLVSAIDDKVKDLTGSPFIGDIGPATAKLKSPMVIDNYLHQFGALSQYATSVMDKILKATGVAEDKSPAMKITDIWFVKSFLARNPTQNAAPITLFGEKYKESEKVIASYNAKTKEYDFSGAQQTLETHPLAVMKLNLLKENEAELSRLGKLIHNIDNLPLSVMSKDNKSEQIDKLTYGMIETAKRANKMLNQIDETIKTRKQ